MAKRTEYVIVKVDLNSEIEPDLVAKEIVANLSAVEWACPAFSDGFGRLVEVTDGRVEA